MGPIRHLTGNGQIRSLGSRTLFGTRIGLRRKDRSALDQVTKDKGVRVPIDPKAVLFLLGAEMDYKVEKLSAQFIFNNPNQTAACGCGESLQLEPASESS
jgi:iron-sulfur cluster assembly accessory protein